MPERKIGLHDFLNFPEHPVLFAVTGNHDSELSSRPHQHARGQLFGSLRGLLSVGVEDAVWVVPAIHAVWLPPHVLHSGQSHGPYHGWSVYIDEAACADLPAHACTLRTSGLLREAVLRACSWELIPAAPLPQEQAHIASVILDEIRTLPVEPFGLPLPRDPRLQRIARALIADPSNNQGMEHWASWAAVSLRTLSRRFVTETGFNFTAWRQRARLMRSLEMLAAGVPVATIAYDLGYSSPSAFISLFRRSFGHTPANYRHQLST
ncbi:MULTISPECIES: AraC family transcriptional regulator [Alcaligenes]|uniref:AraC family transcriptional regulator n=1 Tax=Alcaligenes aquatilis TaxID=323284 RepID=A0A3G2HUI5_9BURK|nr:MULTISPECIES: helix-turn-helix transcriptional regulator [Alcaligenes]AWG34284.1 AraC family transcriptional regulator [Alcaligenes aquatilis]AYN20697.1 AraC family transcriptional regulator [Alcaligenes aquatilis]QXR37510.1 helix-turn-helix transcriptional regulator [Alcaligenes aquatilis]UQN37508.1 helix-turn-helix transcriptional regulator [Alcaligenes aquatilis]UYY88793.1 helix-turn-helix transcriptional regulator [Alcaligenes sp. SMD-FA]